METLKKLGTVRISQHKGRSNSCNVTVIKDIIKFLDTDRVVFNQKPGNLSIRRATLDDNHNVFKLQNTTGTFTFGCKEDPNDIVGNYVFVDDGSEIYKLLNEEEFQELLMEYAEED